MTCKNCGNEMSSGDRFCSRCGSAAVPAFCSQCGTKLESGARQCNACGAAVMSRSQHLDPAALMRAAAARIAPLKDKLAFHSSVVTQNLLPNIQSYRTMLQKNPMNGNLLTAGLLMLALFLWFGKVLTTSVLGYTQGFSMHDMCEGAEFVSYFCAVLLTAGAVFSAFPGLVPTNGIFKKLNVPMVATVWTFVWYLVGVLGASDQVDSFSHYGAEISLTAGGWLLGIVCIVVFALLILEDWQRKLNSNTTH